MINEDPPFLGPGDEEDIPVRLPSPPSLEVFLVYCIRQLIFLLGLAGEETVKRKKETKYFIQRYSGWKGTWPKL